MVVIKTKSEKHSNDDERRRRSIKEKEKAKLNQSLIIKHALLNSSFKNSTSKKIIFNDNEEEENSNKEKEEKKEKITLFDEDNSEDENFEIKEKPQFSTKKGFKLLDLQSTYRNDERFIIDERFIDDEDIDENKNELKEKKETTEVDTEKATQLKVLESVLGQPVANVEDEKNSKKRQFEMVRYDASNKEHKKYEIKPQPSTNICVPTKKKRDKQKKVKSEINSKPPASKEKFYEVSKEIKDSFKKKCEENGQFSLLQTYANQRNNVEITENIEEEAKNFEINKIEEECQYQSEVKDVYVSDDNEIESVKEPELKISEEVAVAKGVWKESFFFVPDDLRFQEALNFMNKKNSKEASEAARNYGKTRRTLKEILRLHMKKQLNNKDPFRTKVGGMNKKQLANPKAKNVKTKFAKRNPLKMNPCTKV